MLDAYGRSMLREGRDRQLDDLRKKPSATDARPDFHWSADSPAYGNMSITSEFPKLLWHRDTGEEITVHDEPQQAHMTGLGYGHDQPAAEPPVPPIEALRAELALLNESDRALVIENQRQMRLKAIQERMAALPDSALDALLAEPKRGPGRPKAS